MTVCADASFLATMLLSDPHWESALAHWGQWTASGDDLIEPPLFYAEVTSVVRVRVHRGELAPEPAQRLASYVSELPITVFTEGEMLQSRALDLAAQFNQPKAYDAQYLAVADLLGCELWTADKRLFNAVTGRLPWVRYVGEAA